jgi:hypothetical protein
VSRLNDDEMRRLMFKVDRTYRFVQTLFDENVGGELSPHLEQLDPLTEVERTRTSEWRTSKRRTD